MIERGIETFLAVVRHKTLKAAATRLNISQSAVSKRVRLLEEEFQVTLFERGKGVKKVVLTRAGENFIDLAERLLGILQEAKALNVRPGARRLTIGAVASLNAALMPYLYSKLFNHKSPIHVTVVTLHPAEMYDEVDLRHIDTGFCPLHQVHPGVSATPCFSEPLVGVAHAHVPHFAREVVPLADLDPAENVYATWTTEYRVWYSEHFSPSAAKVHVDDPNTLFKMLQHKAQWTIVPLSVARHFYAKDRYHVFQLDPEPPERVIYTLRHRLPLKGTAKLLKIADGYAKDMFDALLGQEFFGRKGVFFPEESVKKSRAG